MGFRFRNAATVSKLNHVLFEDGFANVGNEERYGGAVELYQAEVEIDSCSFRGNRARIDGGAIYCRDAATLTVRDCEFSGDSTRFGGGGAILARTSGSITIERCRFENNKAATSGGAVMVESGVTPRIENCYFANNIALQRGGAVQLRSSPVAGYMRDCVIEACTADLGGALYLDNTRATIEACSLRLCDARVGGGIAARGSNNTSPILRTVISGNSAIEDGGGLYFVESARCVVTNSIVTDNRATRGGAVYGAVSSAPVLRFVAIDGNAATEGSAISFNGAGTLTSSIVTGEDSLIYFAELATSQIRFSDIFSIEGNELTGFVPDGLLRETRLNVALVECDSLRNFSRNPEFVNAELGDFRLSDNSPCLFGADTSNSNGNDFAGELRVAPEGSWPDMGAFESDAPLPLAGNCGSASGVWYPGDYIIPCSLRVEWQDTLIIMAGSKLLFAPGAGLYVRGNVAGAWNRT
ncbi:MAG: right-handed parallel beta-helix repeat-containing protein [bacterium]|nr:right-handed parallel beta-helix repeat-containing protein [bacterium]